MRRGIRSFHNKECDVGDKSRLYRKAGLKGRMCTMVCGESGRKGEGRKASVTFIIKYVEEKECARDVSAERKNSGV